MTFEDTIYEETEFSFDSEHTEEAVEFSPSYEGEEGSMNFTQGIMERLGYEPGTQGEYGLEMSRDKDGVSAEVNEDGRVYFPKDQDGDLLEAVESFRELV